MATLLFIGGTVFLTALTYVGVTRILRGLEDAGRATRRDE
jgi:hypothetical protein